MTGAGDDGVLRIAAGCDAAQAPAERARLAERVALAGAGAPLRVDLTPGTPTAFALQLAAATAATLRQRGAFAGYGPDAARALALPTDGAA